MKQLSEKDFDKVINSSELVMVDFYADWCGPCKMLPPIMKNLSDKFSDISFYKADVDVEIGLATKFGISSIPTVILFKNKIAVEKVTGALPEIKYAQLIQKHQ